MVTGDDQRTGGGSSLLTCIPGGVLIALVYIDHLT